jgi:archaeal type IV pilus assembly protein PilA
VLGRRGASEVIAAMLLIVITVAASVLLYAYVSGLMGRLQGAAVSQPYLEQVSLDYYDWTSLSTLKLTIRNVGVAKVTKSDVFVNGVLQTATLSNVGGGTGCNSPTGNIPLNTVCSETITSFASTTFSGSATPTSGVAYTVKIATKDGAIFSYSCIAGQAA